MATRKPLTAEQLEKRRSAARIRKEEQRQAEAAYAARLAVHQAAVRRAAEELAQDEAESAAWLSDYERRTGKSLRRTRTFTDVNAGESLDMGVPRYERRRIQAEEALAAGDCSNKAVKTFFAYLKERSDDSNVASYGGGMRALIFRRERDAFKKRVLEKCNISLQGLRRSRK